MNPIYLYIETQIIDENKAKDLNEEEKSKLINPIDSKICAIGIKKGENEDIFSSSNENDILQSFWKFLGTNKGFFKIIGFSTKNFDMPFIVARSFILDVEVEPFSLKEILDLREQIHAFRYGQTRGKLSEFGEIFGIQTEDDDDFQSKISKNLNIIEEMHKRIISTKIDKIKRF